MNANPLVQAGSLKELCLFALFRPLKESIWPSYTLILHPDLNCLRGGGDLLNCRTAYEESDEKPAPAHPYLIMKYLSKFLSIALPTLYSVFVSEGNGELCRVINFYLSPLLSFVTWYWCNLWKFHFVIGPQDWNSEIFFARCGCPAYFINHIKRNGKFAWKGSLSPAIFGRSMEHHLETHRKLCDLMDALDQVDLVSDVVALEGDLDDFNFGDLYSQSGVSYVEALERSIINGFLPIYTRPFRLFDAFIRGFVCYSEINCAWPLSGVYSCPTERVNDCLNSNLCGGIRWKPAADRRLMQQAVNGTGLDGLSPSLDLTRAEGREERISGWEEWLAERRTHLEKSTICEGCLMDAITSPSVPEPSKKKDWSIIYACLIDTTFCNSWAEAVEDDLEEEVRWVKYPVKPTMEEQIYISKKLEIQLLRSFYWEENITVEIRSLRPFQEFCPKALEQFCPVKYPVKVQEVEEIIKKKEISCNQRVRRYTLEEDFYGEDSVEEIEIPPASSFVDTGVALMELYEED